MPTSPRPSPGAAAPHRPRPPGGRGGGLLVLILFGVTAFGLLAYLPLVPCGSCRGAAYQERLRIASLPGVTPGKRAAVLSFAESDECGRCRRGRKTIFGWWLGRVVCGV